MFFALLFRSIILVSCTVYALVSNASTYVVNNIADNYLPKASYCQVPDGSNRCNFRSAWSACTGGSCKIQLPSDSVLIFNASMGLLYLQDYQQIEVMGGMKTIFTTSAMTTSQNSQSYSTGTLSNTNSATQNYASYCLNICAGITLTVCGCNADTTGDTYFRLYLGTNQVADNDDYCGSKSKIVYTATDSSCPQYCIHFGCFFSETCTIKADITTSYTPPTKFISYIQQATIGTNTSLIVRNVSLVGFGNRQVNGGAFNFNGNLSFHLENIQFQGNLGNYGGAIYVQNNQSPMKHIQYCSFQGNLAGSGGGIYIDNNVKHIYLYNNVFWNNTAKYGIGGSIMINTLNSDIQIINTTFVHSVGGVVYIGSNNDHIRFQTFTSTDSTGGGSAFIIQSYNSFISMIDGVLSNNVATMSYGGLLYADTHIHDFLLENVRFVNGTSQQHGGCAYIYDITRLFMRNVQFENCVSNGENGGAMYLYGNDLTFIDVTFIESRAAVSGGGIYIDSANNVFMQNISVYHTTAISLGGFLYCIYCFNFTLSNSVFDSSSSKNGGSLYLSGSNNVTIMNNRFVYSSAWGRGGALYLLQISTVVVDNCVFDTNHAIVAGGAIYLLQNVNHMTISNSSFLNCNASSDCGGAVYADTNNYDVLFDLNSFINCTALGNGGGVYVNEYNSLVAFHNNLFDGCVSKLQFGGGLAINEFNENVAIQRNLFQHNQAVSSSGGGLAVIYSNSFVSLSANNFKSNSAGVKGGGIYLQNANSFFSIVDSQAAALMKVVQSAHPYISGSADHYGDPVLIFSATVQIQNVNEYVIVFDNLCNLYITETLTIYDSSNKQQILYQTTNGENIYPGVNLPILRVLMPSFYVEFIGPTTNDYYVKDGYYGFKMYVYPILPVAITQRDVFVGNVAGVSGGAIAFDISNTFPLLINTYLRGNTAAAGDGGAIFYNFGNVGAALFQVIFDSNEALASGGGLEFLSGHYGVTLRTCVFQNNSALKGNGGGLIVGTGNGNGVFDYGNTLQIDQCHFIENTAQTMGGAIYIDNKNTIDITTAVVQGNIAVTSNGGGVAVYSGNTLSISLNTSITYNIAGGNGGGVAIMSGNTVVFTGNNSLGNNHAVVVGGGLSIVGSEITFTGVQTIDGNQADFMGGGISFQSSPLWQYSSTDAGIKLINNYASRGSAWAFYDMSNIKVGDWSNIQIENNRATVGGTSYWIYDKSTVQLMSHVIMGLKSSGINWRNNIAPYGLQYATQGIHIHSPSVYSVEQFNGQALYPPISVSMTDYYDQYLPLNGSSNVLIGIDSDFAANCRGQNPFLSGSDAVGGTTFLQGQAVFSQLQAYCSPKGNMTLQYTVQIASDFGTIIPSYKAQSYYIQNTTQLLFRHCKPGEYELESNCVPCPPGSYSLYPDSLACFDCSKTSGVASCETEQIVVESNYWRRFNYTTAVLSCPLKGACVGGNLTGNALCATGYEGPLCAVCSYGYSQVQNSCVACSSSQQINPTVILILTAIGIALAVLSGYVYFHYIYVDTSKNTDINSFNIFDQYQRGALNIFQVVFVWLKFKYTEMGPKLKIIVSTFQIIASAGFVLAVDMPVVFKNFSDSLNFLSLDISSIIPLDCTREFDFMTNLLVTTLFPIILSLLLLSAIVVEYAYQRYLFDMQSSQSSLEERNLQLKWILENIFDKYINYIFILTYLVLPSVTTTIFQTFICQTIDPNNENQSNEDDYYLVVDRSISCETDYYRNWMIYAIFMTFIYPIGVPTLYFMLLYQNRQEISERNNPILVEEKPLLAKTESENEELVMTEMKSSNDKELSSKNATIINPMINSTESDIEQQTEVKAGTEPTKLASVTTPTGTTRTLSPAAARLTFLFAAYKPDLWYWEVVETTRRLMLTAVLSVCGSGTALQNIISMVLAFGYIKLYATCRPYNRHRNGILSETGQAQIFFTYFVALIIQNSLLTGDGWNNFLGFLLISLNLSIILITIYFEIESYQLQREEFQKYVQEQEMKAAKEAVANDQQHVEQTQRIETNETVVEVELITMDNSMKHKN